MRERRLVRRRAAATSSVRACSMGTLLVRRYPLLPSRNSSADVDVSWRGQIVAGDEARFEARAPSSGTWGHDRAGEQHRMQAAARRRPPRRRHRPRCATTRRPGRRRADRGRGRPRARRPPPRPPPGGAPSPQRSEAPGPSAQSGQRTVASSVSTSCAPSTTRIPSSVVLSRSAASTLGEQLLLLRRRGAVAGRRARGEDDRPDHGVRNNRRGGPALLDVRDVRLRLRPRCAAGSVDGGRAGVVCGDAEQCEEPEPHQAAGPSAAETAATARRTSARATSTFQAVRGSGVAASSPSSPSRSHGNGRHTGQRDPRIAAAYAPQRRRPAGTTSACGPSPSGRCSASTGGSSSSRISSAGRSVTTARSSSVGRR